MVTHMNTSLIKGKIKKSTLSVEKTAEKIGISAQALRCALRGETELRCETAKKLAELLKVNLLDLYVKNKETQEEIRKNIIEGYLYSEEFTGIEQKENELEGLKKKVEDLEERMEQLEKSEEKKEAERLKELVKRIYGE